jgi:dolichol-phosphate mannosyltransferase
MNAVQAAAKSPELSIVMPCFNEQDCLPHTLQELVPALERGVDGSWEILLVDDGSTDRTFALCQAAHANEPRIKVIRLSRNFGHQAAVTAGLAFVSGAHVGVMDADLQDPVEVLMELHRQVRDEDLDVCIGVRRSRDAPLWLRLAYRLFYYAIGRFSQPPWPRDAGDFCVFNQRVHRVLLALPERARTLRGLRAWVGFRQGRVEFDRPARTRGHTKYNLLKLAGLAIDSFVAFSSLPLRLASLAGILMSLATLTIGLLFLLNRIFPQATVLGYWVGENPGVTTIVLYLSLIASMLFFCLGIIGEYVLLLLRESQQRPTAVIDVALGIRDENAHEVSRIGTTLMAPRPRSER